MSTTPAPARVALEHAIKNDRAQIRRHGFGEFVRRAWPAVFPAKQYRERWYHRALYAELQDLHDRKFMDLAIAMPPATNKSTAISIFYPAYRWLSSPGEGILSATYDQGLGSNWARSMRALVCSRWFVERFGHVVRADVDANGRRLTAGVREFFNDRGGFLYSTTCPRGPVTGRHPGLRKVDDSIKPINATAQGLATVNEWYGTTWASRAENAKAVQNLIGQQRLAKNDLVDHVVANAGFRLFSLPAEFDPERANARDVRTEPGELLDAERLDAAQLAKLRIMLGSAFAAQYNQNPSGDGSTFRREDFQLFETQPPLAGPGAFDFGVISVDCTFKEVATSDLVCIQAWGVCGPNFFLIDQTHERLGFVDTVRAVAEMMERHPWIHTKLIEDKANGSAVIDTFKRSIVGIEPVTPLGGKVPRANAVAPAVRTGNVWIPRHAPWREKFLEEVGAFPGVAHDDQVDAMSQALAYMLSLGFGSDVQQYIDLEWLSALYAR